MTTTTEPVTSTRKLQQPGDKPAKGGAKKGASKARPKAKPSATRSPKTTPQGAAKGGAKSAPKPVLWPSAEKPSMILLSPKIAGARRTRRSARRAAALSMAMLGLTAAVFIPVAVGTENAKADLAKHVALGETYKAALEANAPVQDYYNGFITQKRLTSTALDGDVSFSRVLASISASNSVGAEISDVLTTASTVASVTGDPFGGSSPLGYVEVKGTVPSTQALGDFVQALNAEDKILADAYTTAAVNGENGTEFTLTVGYTDQAYSFKGVTFTPTEEEAAFAARVQDAIAQEATDDAAVAAAKEATK